MRPEALRLGGRFCRQHLDRDLAPEARAPRRTYTQSHMDYVVEGIIEFYQRRKEIRGLRLVHRPAVLPHFTATFEQVSRQVSEVRG